MIFYSEIVKNKVNVEPEMDEFLVIIWENLENIQSMSNMGSYRKYSIYA